MDIKKNNGSKCLLSHGSDKQVNGDGKSSSCSSFKLRDVGSSGNGRALKIRKPYTITKQREKWTEEEHNKFIEALQFYGRDWRRIEDYVGTKTAVQIRSHAQKFFSKVAQESASNGSSGTSKTIEIPPPRPKRKPNHPYPRKLGSACSQASRVLPQLGMHSLQTRSVPEQDDRSPTSVLCSSGSDKSAGDRGKGVRSAIVNLAKGDNYMNMDLDAQLPGGKVTSEEASSAEVAAIKLFGKVVPLADHSSKVCPSEASSMAPELKSPFAVDPDVQNTQPSYVCNYLDCPIQPDDEQAIICGDEEAAGVYLLDELNTSFNLH